MDQDASERSSLIAAPAEQPSIVEPATMVIGGQVVEVGIENGRVVLDVSIGQLGILLEGEQHPMLQIPEPKNPAIYLPEPDTLRHVQTPYPTAESDHVMLAALMCEQSPKGEIARRIHQKEWSIAEFAFESKVSERQLRRILTEPQKRGPNMATKRLIARTLDCRVDDIWSPPGAGGEHGNGRSEDHQG